MKIPNNDYIKNPGEVDKNELIRQYLTRQLNEKEAQDFEQLAEKDAFLKDAVEGLEKIRPQNLLSLREELGMDLSRKLKKRNHRKNQSLLPPYVLYALLLLLLLLVISVIILNRFLT